MKQTVRSLSILFLFIFLTAQTIGAAVITADLQAVLDTAKPGDIVSAILRFKTKADLGPIASLPSADRRASVIDILQNTASASRTAIDAILRTPAVKDSQSLWIINGLAIKASPSAFRALANNPTVESIRLDAEIRLPKTEVITEDQPVSSLLSTGTATLSSAPSEWNIGAVRADELWNQGYTGQGVVVAGMDSGVDALHADLSGSWRGGANSWYDPNGEHATPFDASGHGTQTMGIIVGGDATGTSIGVAPGAEWIAVKIFNDAGSAALSVIHLGYQWLLDPDGNTGTDDAPDIVNNSWGLDQNTDMCIEEFRSDIQALKAAGIAVVFAAGNNGSGAATSISPANNAEGFAVGNVDSSSTIALSSSRGPSACEGDIYPEVVAPGVNIKTATLTYGGIFPTFYAYVSGTSAAAPHVSGVMALLKSADPNITVAEMEYALLQTCADLGSPGADDDYGNGLIDVVAAYGTIGGTPTCTDGDGDGYFAEGGCGTTIDCNDGDATIYPGATEIPDDGIDQDCDGVDLVLCVDNDNDGYYAAADCGTEVDCDDTDPAVYPGAVEIADDGIDQDCDGEDLTLCVDADGDGFYAASDCGTGVDCDDSDATVYPGAAEVKHDGIDQDCNGYDMTLEITRAIYRTSKDTVIILATTDLAENGNPVADIPGIGVVNMNWNATYDRWQRAVAEAVSKGFDPDNPGSVVVTGAEGVETEPIRIR